VPQKARPDRGPLQRRPQPRRIGRRQLEPIDQKPLVLLGAHLGGLLDVRVHDLGEQLGVDRILIDRIQLREHPAQHRPQHVGR